MSKCMICNRQVECEDYECAISGKVLKLYGEIIVQTVQTKIANLLAANSELLLLSTFYEESFLHRIS